MAKRTLLSTPLFLGEDHVFSCEVNNADESAAVNITGWSLSWMLKSSRNDLDAAALLTKTTAAGGITISGVYNATPALNTQRAVVAIADTNTDALTEGVKQWELKRTDADYETVLAYGTVELRRGLHRT